MLDADLDLALIGLCQNLFHFLRRLLDAIQSIARETTFRGLAGTTHKSYGNYYGKNRDCQSSQVKNREEKTPVALNERSAGLPDVVLDFEPSPILRG